MGFGGRGRRRGVRGVRSDHQRRRRLLQLDRRRHDAAAAKAAGSARRQPSARRRLGSRGCRRRRRRRATSRRQRPLGACRRRRRRWRRRAHQLEPCALWGEGSGEPQALRDARARGRRRAQDGARRQPGASSGGARAGFVRQRRIASPQWRLKVRAIGSAEAHEARTLADRRCGHGRGRLRVPGREQSTQLEQRALEGLPLATTRCLRIHHVHRPPQQAGSAHDSAHARRRRRRGRCCDRRCGRCCGR